MSEVIQVLEQIGSDASLQSKQAIAQLLTTALLPVEEAYAVINKDVISLERQLDVRTNIICAIYPAEDDESEEKNDDNDDNNSTEENQNNAIGF